MSYKEGIREESGGLVLLILYLFVTSTEVPLLSSGGAGRRLPDESSPVLDLGQIRIVVQEVHHDWIVDFGLEQEGVGDAARYEYDEEYDEQSQIQEYG